MRILFLTDNFPPEYNAPATRTYEHCKEWIKLGAEVTVITCFPNFPQGKVFNGYKNKWKQEEYMDGIRVVRVWSFITSNEGTFKRTLDFISFAFTAFLAGLRIKSDIIIATSPQFFTAISGCILGYVKRKPWVMEVRDIWPESIKAVEAVKSDLIINFFEIIELFLYKSAHKIVVVTDSFKVILTNRGVPPNKIFIIKNGVDLSIYQPRSKNASLIRDLKLNNKFIIGYVGTHGLAHSLDFIVQSISKLSDPTIHFIFIGDGAAKKGVVATAEQLHLNNITFIDPVKKNEISNYLSIIDVSLVPLRKTTTFESVIPSKIFESVAMNIPILLGVNGEIRRIVEHYNAGVFFQPEDEAEFIQKIQEIKQRMTHTPEYYMEGCKQMAEDFNRRELAKRMLQILN